MKMKIVFMGTPLFAVEVLEMLIKEHDVCLVVTQPDKITGRKKVLTPPVVKEVALKHGIEVFQPANIKTDYQKIIDLKPDFMITAAYGQILPKALLDEVKAINVHGSLLPKYRGGAPIQYALFNGDQKTGVTIMYMAFKMDSGDIIKQETLDIKKDDDTLSLTKRLSTLGTKLLKEVLEDISQGIIHREKQDENLVTFSPTLSYQDEFLSFNQKSEDIINKVKGLSPEPGAHAFINDMKIKIYKVENSDIIEHEDKRPGTILSVKKELLVKTLDGVIKIKLIQIPGKKMMAAKDFLNGQNVMYIDDIFNRGEEL
jgi:methionyl-tRNA formyltransferase